MTDYGAAWQWLPATRFDDCDVDEFNIGRPSHWAYLHESGTDNED